MASKEHHEHHEHGHGHAGVTYEHKDTNVSSIVNIMLTFLVFGVLGVVILPPMYRYFVPAPTTNTNTDRQDSATKPRLENEPKLQGIPTYNPNDPVDEVKVWKENELGTPEKPGKLHSFGYVDPEKKIVRIPIEDAKKAMLKTGFPVKAATTGMTAAGDPGGAPAPAPTNATPTEAPKTETPKPAEPGK